MSDIFGGPPDDQEYDIFGYPLDYGDVQSRDIRGLDPYGFWGGLEPDPYWYETIDIEDEDGGMHELTVQQWYSVTMSDPEWIHDTYNLSVNDLILQLQYTYGFWTNEDWRVWREHYELVYGG